MLWLQVPNKRQGQREDNHQTCISAITTRKSESLLECRSAFLSG